MSKTYFDMNRLDGVPVTVKCIEDGCDNLRKDHGWLRCWDCTVDRIFTAPWTYEK